MAALLASREAEEISKFHAFVDGKGTKPFRLALSPVLILLHAELAVGAFTVTGTAWNLLESAVDVAVIVAVAAPVPAGVKITAVPELMPNVALSVPASSGLTERFTVFVNAPVPVTVGVQSVV